MMEIVTIICARDKVDIELQAHSIDRFVHPTTTHHIVIEDDEISMSDWQEILAPHYTRHTLNLIKANPREDKQFGLPSPLGHRRVGYLKLETVAKCKTDKVLVLDGKNIFIRPTDLQEWSIINHGNGKLHDVSDIDYREDGRSKGSVPLKWAKYVCSQFANSELPKRFPVPLETPYVMNSNLVRSIVARPEYTRQLFLQDMIWPFTELHLYFCFVPDEELGVHVDKFCSAVTRDSKDDSTPWSYFIGKEIGRVGNMNSPTHGLHRKPRTDMGNIARDIYRRWLLSCGLEDPYVTNYVHFDMPDKTW